MRGSCLPQSHSADWDPVLPLHLRVQFQLQSLTVPLHKNTRAHAHLVTQPHPTLPSTFCLRSLSQLLYHVSLSELWVSPGHLDFLA